MASNKTAQAADSGHVDIDLDALIAQRAEARGDEGDIVAFQFKGERWTYRDPELLTDEEKEALRDITFDVDIAEWYMGIDQYDRFALAGGNSSIFWMAFKKHQADVRDEMQGNPTQSSRSSRRSQRR